MEKCKNLKDEIKIIKDYNMIIEKEKKIKDNEINKINNYFKLIKYYNYIFYNINFSLIMSKKELSEIEISLLETINFLRLHPHMYTKIIENSTILNTDEKVLLNNKLFKLDNHYKPLKNLEILNICAQSMLYYCILHDKGINELNISSIEMDEYFIKNIMNLLFLMKIILKK